MQHETLLASALGALMLAGCTDSPELTSSQDAATLLAGHTHTSTVANGYWPPQPLNITEVEPQSANALSGVLQSVLDAARSTVMNNPNTRELLGNNFAEISAQMGSDKDLFTAEFSFYNYDLDQSIDLALLPSGEVTSNTYPALAYQPPESPNESETAIALAKTDLDNAGFDTSGLIGTALLAYPPASQVENEDEHFYPQRIIYVTFYPGADALPVYSALVNLSDQTVSESGLAK